MIYLYVHNETDSYMVDMSKSLRADEIKELFGTYHLPTPYTIKSDPKKVLREIQALNPNEKVTCLYSEFISR